MRYEIQREFVSSRGKTGQFRMGIKSQSEGFKAIYDASDRTRFTVSYTFGGSSLYEVRTHYGGKKIIQAINEDGKRHTRPRTIGNVSAVKRLFGNAKSITIHGGRK